MTTTLLAASGVLAFVALAAVALMWHDSPTAGNELQTLLDTSEDARTLAILPLIAAGLAATIGAIAASRGWRWGPWFLALAACVEAAGYARPNLRETPSLRLRAPPPREAARLAWDVASQHVRVGGDIERVVGMGGWPEVRSVTPIAPKRYASFIEASTGPIVFTKFGLAKNRTALADLAAVRYLVVSRRGDKQLEGDPLVTQIDSAQGVSIFRNDGALPRARVVHRSLLAGSTEDAIAMLTRLAAEPAHVAETPLADAAIVEPVPGAPPPPALGGWAATPVEWVKDTPDAIDLKATLTEPGYLILADTYYPGWQATVDGQQRTIYPANVGFRAVYLDAGSHRIEFRYRPTSVRLGFALALLAALISILLVSKTSRRRAHPWPAPANTVAGPVGRLLARMKRRGPHIGAVPIRAESHDATTAKSFGQSE